MSLFLTGATDMHRKMYSCGCHLRPTIRPQMPESACECPLTSLPRARGCDGGLAPFPGAGPAACQRSEFTS